MSPHMKISSSRGGLISHRSHLKLTSLIRQNLGDENLRTIFSSCFRHLFFLDSLKFQGQLYNLLLRSVDKPSLARNCLSFCLSGRFIDFSPRDFGLITWLKFSDWYDPPVESDIHRSVFSKKQQISLGDIIEAFKKECKISGGTSLMSLKLAFLVMLYGVLLVVGGKNNSIDKTYMHLIDDIDKFNTFPWGSVAYMCLVKRTHRARENLENILINDRKIAFDANGFVLALQVWAYEVVPILSRNCATKIEGSDVLLPRMRKWAAMNHLKFDFLNKLILKSHPDSMETMKTSTDEEEYVNNLGVDKFDHAISSLIIEENQLICCKKSKLIKTDALTSEIGSFTDQMEKLKSPGVMDFIAKHVADLQECINVVSKSQMVSEKSEIKVASMNSPMKSIVDDKEESSRLRPGKAKLLKENATSPPPFKRPCTRSFEASTKISCGNVLNESLPSAKLVQNVLSRRFNPNEPEFRGTLMKKFEDWRSGSKNNVLSGRLVLPFFKGLQVNVNWFSKICERRGWLHTELINCLLNLITLKTKSDPAVFVEWTFMELGCWGALTSENDTLVRERVGPYLCGILPRQGHLNWSRATKVFGVGHVNGNHLISFVILLDELRIVVYDSDSGSSTWPKLETTFNRVARNLEKMCRELCIWELKGVAVGSHFEVVRYGSTPQQVNDSDCGVMTIKFFECFANGALVDDVDSTRCGAFRRSYAKQIFDLAIPDTTTSSCPCNTRYN